MALPPFHNVIFPENVSYGASGGPTFQTSVVELASGAEQRNVNWKFQRAEYDVSHGIKTREQMEHLLEFFSARRGKAYGFRFKDWMDFRMERQPVATPNENRQQQVFKTYERETDFAIVRPLYKLVPDTITVWRDGVEIDPASIEIDHNTGIFVCNPNTLIEIECEFHVPVRFDTDQMKITHDDFEQMSWPSIPLVELKARL